jgi:outer membrane murein-binding lipoprotein Lpp
MRTLATFISVNKSSGVRQMASKARAAFDKNAKDIERLLELHKNEGGADRGRRYGLEVLNKSAIVLLTAFWEAYCEDIAAEGLEHLVKHLKDPTNLPDALKKSVSKRLKSDVHELSVWEVSGDAWRSYLRAQFAALKESRDRKLNTPKTVQIVDLFRDSVGVEDIAASWKWAKKMTARRAKEKLDRMVTLRGSIAHRGVNEAAVTKAQVTDYFDFIKRLVAVTGGAVNSHVKAATGKPLWRK